MGGGLAVFAGRDDLDPISWNSLAAQQFLPARVLGPIRFFDGDASLELDSQSHPLFEEFRSETDGTSMLADIDFWRCWSVEPNEDATVLASFSNTTRKAAIVERPVREGRVIMVTTAIDFLREGGQEWNTLADSWSFLMLVNNTMRQLDWQLSRTSNFISGQAVTIRLTEAEQFESFFLRDPELRQTKRQRPAEASTLTIEDAREPGHYEVRSLDETIPFRTGFSVNLPSDESDLTTLTNLELDKLIGEKRYSRARRMDELDRVVADMRMGREVFPLLLMVAIAFFVGEHLLANWFYDLEHEDESRPTGWNLVRPETPSYVTSLRTHLVVVHRHPGVHRPDCARAADVSQTHSPPATTTPSTLARPATRRGSGTQPGHAASVDQHDGD